MRVGYDSPESEGVTHGCNGGLACNVKIDSWERLPHPIIIDSGASTSVMPLSWCAHTETRPTEASEKAQHFTAANGGKIYNMGEKVVTMMSREGHKRNMKFTSCGVERALGSVSSICSQGHTVVFHSADHPDGSCILNLTTREKMYMTRKEGAYVLDTKIAPKFKQARPFGGPGR